MIDSCKVIELLSDEDIKKIIISMGGVYRIENANEIIFSSVCHHSTSYKLYYYKQSKTFFCFSQCGSMSLFDVVANVQGFYGKDTFQQSFNYICEFFNIDRNEGRSHKRGFGKQNENLENELKILNSHKKKEVKREFKMLPTYKETYLNLYQSYYP